MLGDQSFLAACFCVKYSIVYFLLRTQATEIVSAVFFVVKIACSASCRVEKCNDLERNLKMSLNIIDIFMSNRNRHIPEMDP